MTRPQTSGEQIRQAAKPGIPNVARIRHLRQAAMHLAAAGYGEHASKAKNEIQRLEQELKKSEAGAPAGPNAFPARGAIREKRQPQAPGKQATADAMSIELRKLQKLIAHMDARMRKLEANSRPGPSGD